MIGLFGDLKGQVCFTLKEPLALLIAAKILGDDEIHEVDEIVKSALCELCNMILGNAMGALYNMEIRLDITPPTIFTGRDINFTVERMETSTARFTINGAYELNICIALPPM